MAGMTRIACLVVPGADEQAQQLLLELALAHSPSVEDGGPGVVYLDLRGLEGLFGGEKEIARRLLDAMTERGLAGRIGVAGSRAGSRFATRRGDGITIIPFGQDARRLGPAPLALLDLDPRMAARFSRWGIRTLGELADLPARGLAERLGDEGQRIRRQEGSGEGEEPLNIEVKNLELSNVDALLLRLALAQKAAGRPEAASSVTTLLARFDASRARGDTVHRRHLQNVLLIEHSKVALVLFDLFQHPNTALGVAAIGGVASVARGMTEADTATTGVASRAACPRIRLSASIPSMSGSWMSIRIRSGRALSAKATPASPVSASIVAWPLWRRMSRTSFMFFSLSSTIRIVFIVQSPNARTRIRATRSFDDLGAQDYKNAAKEFEEVDRQHPYSVWATKAQIMAAFTYYQSNKYDDAIIALDRFIQLHPGHRDIPYAYYLKALCYYEQISDIGRDQRLTQQALDALAEVVKRFPESPYARDARLKVELAIDHLAGKEMAVGRYYQANSQYIGAINRYRVVIERYQTTTHVPEALHRLVESYLSLGVKSEAQEAAAVLGYNFPGSDWYQDSYYLMTGEGTPAPVDERRWFFGLF
jgi:outer membrane protein assembly factor BamD